LSQSDLLTRRSLLFAAAGAAVGLAGCSGSEKSATVAGTTSAATTTTATLDCPAATRGGALWQVAARRGIVYGSSAATWQLSDPQYRRLFERQPAIVFTEDDLLWWRLRPTPKDDIDFKYGDQIVGFAERNGMLVFGAHLVWDQGFGEGWAEDDLWGLNEARARELLFGTLEETVAHYKGRIAGWLVANEVLDGAGMRTDTPWYEALGPGYVAEAFRRTAELDPDATLVLNDYGYETDDEFLIAADKRAATLEFLDELLDAHVPVHALGIQAHLQADHFPDGFDGDAYRAFLAEVAKRGLRILYTEMDVLDDGLPANPRERDGAVAEVMDQYLSVALQEPAVAALMTFGLSDRYTWLQEDYPRADEAPRRPLVFDENMKPKPAYEVLEANLESAPVRELLWRPPRCA
jgi:endo-1,4-beta-xylanase